MTGLPAEAPWNDAHRRLGLLLLAAVAFAIAGHTAILLTFARDNPAALPEPPQLPAAAFAAGFSGLGVLLLLLAAFRGKAIAGLRVATFSGLLLIGTLAVISGLTTQEYGVDSIAHTRYAASLLLSGANPYRDFYVQTALEHYPVASPSITYHTDGSLMDIWTYPAGAFLVVAPFEALGVDARFLYGGALLLLMGLIAARTKAPFRPAVLSLMVLHQWLYQGAVGAGFGEPLWVLLVVLAWLSRGRPLLGGLILGLAVTVKQPAWFFVPFFLIAVGHRAGPRTAAKSAVAAGAVSVSTNLPFFISEPLAWTQGVLAPVLLPLPVLGFGIARLGALALPQVPSWAYAGTEAAAFVLALAAYWRWGRAAPALALVLPWLPLWFAWRSLSSYFYLLPIALLCELMGRRDTREDHPRGDMAVQLALITIAIIALALGSRFEALLWLEDFRGLGLGIRERMAQALFGTLFGALALGLLLFAASGRASRLAHLWALFTGLLVFALQTTVATVQAPERYDIGTAATTLAVLGMPEIRYVYLFGLAGLVLVLYAVAPSRWKLPCLALAIAVQFIAPASAAFRHGDGLWLLLLAGAWVPLLLAIGVMAGARSEWATARP